MFAELDAYIFSLTDLRKARGKLDRRRVMNILIWGMSAELDVYTFVLVL